MKKILSFVLLLAIFLTQFSMLPVVSAATVETVTVQVEVTGVYMGVNEWEDATFTITVTDGVPADYGTLSNGKYNFQYWPATGMMGITNGTQTDGDFGFSFVNGPVANIVIPKSIAAFSVASKEVANTTNYDAKTIGIKASKYYCLFKNLATEDPNNDVKKIIFADGIEKIDNAACYKLPTNNKELEIILPEGLKTIGSDAFNGGASSCAIYTEIVIPDSVTSIGGSAFGLTKIPTITFPKGITALMDNTLQNAVSLTSVTFKGEVTSLKSGTKGAFAGNKVLTTVIFEGKKAPTTMCTITGAGAGKLTIYYPADGMGYEDETNFRSFFPDTTTFVPVAVVPTASGITLTGKNLVGETLTGKYTKFTAADDCIESGSTCTWQRASDVNFITNVEDIKTEAISAGVTSSYTLTNADANKYIRFCVIPRSDATQNNVGDTISAVLDGMVRVPQTKPITTLLSPKDGSKFRVGRDIEFTATAECDGTEIVKIEYYANNTKCVESTTAPFSATWNGAQVGTCQVFARAYNALGEYSDSAVATVTIIDVTAPTGSIWAEKWSYDFNQFTSTDIYTNATGITLPGTNPPTVSISTGGTVQSESGVLNNDPNDYYMVVNSISGAAVPANISLDISKLDAPVENIIAQMDVAFSTTTENRNIFSYRTPAYPYNSICFANDGKIKYNSSSGYLTFKTEDGQDMTYETGVFYRVAVKFDFVNKTMIYYLNGEELMAQDNTPQSPNDFVSTSQIVVSGTHNSSQTGIMYVDNLFIGQEQESLVTSVLSSPLAGYNLKGSAIKFTGYAKDSTGKEITKVEFYANDNLIAEKQGSEYNFTYSDLAPGSYDIVARAVNEDGETGDSKTVHVVVDGIFLPKIYSDGMLLQRNKPLKIAGTGIDGVTVTATLNGDSGNATVENDKWCITLPPQTANKSTTLSISTSEGIIRTFKDVAIGELIVCAGQSNMAYSLYKFRNLTPEADADYPDIRLFVQPEKNSGSAQSDIPTGYWTPATKSAATCFSAVGFMAGKDFYLSQNGEVPVGLIYAAIGGSGVSTWIAPGSYDYDPDLAAMKSNSGKNYNAMVAPITNYTIGSVMWYQGEADSPLTYNYEKMLTAYIKGWRRAWDDESIDFVVVQLPIYNYLLSYKSARSAIGVREGQFNVSETLENVATVIAIDTGDAGGIHPTDKKPITERISLALQHFKGKENPNLVWKSPSYDYSVQKDGYMEIYFKDVAAGLKTKDDQAPRGFKLAGDDGVFADATVELKDNVIIVDTSSVVGTPKVRYAFEDSPTAVDKKSTINFVNSAGLPVAPFRTDRDRYSFKNYDVTTNTFSDVVNFTPAICDITVSSVIDNKAIITVDAKDYDDYVEKVDVYADSQLLGTATKNADGLFTYEWLCPAVGTHSIYAIATDTAGATSIKRDPSLGTNTVSPQLFTKILINESVFTIEDLSGNLIANFDGKDGVKAKVAENADGALLIIAAYKGNELVKLKISTETSVQLTAAELTDATTIKVFMFDNLTNITPIVNRPSVINRY